MFEDTIINSNKNENTDIKQVKNNKNTDVKQKKQRRCDKNYLRK